MAEWTLRKYASGIYTTYPISNVNISLSLSGINVASITTHIDNSGTKISVGDEVEISYNSTVMFVGFVDTSNQSNKSTYQLTISEKANEMQNIYVYDGSSYRVPVDNSDHLTTFSEYIAVCLNTGVSGHASGWVDGGNASVKSSLVAPGTSTYYPSVLFSYSNCYEGLRHMVEDVASIKFRFDYDQSTGVKTLRYGTISSPSDTYTLSTTVVDVTDYIIDTLDDEDIYDYALDKVIVVKSGDSSITGSATVASPSSPPKTVVYQYDNVTDVAEATAMAEAILNQRSSANAIKTIYLPVGFSGIQEGDYVQIDASYYAVTKIQYTLNETVVDLDGIFLDVWQQYSQKKQVTSSGVFEGVESTWDGGKRNLYATDGTEYNFYCSDISKIGDDFDITIDYDYWDSEISINNRSMSNGSTNNYTNIDSTEYAGVVSAISGLTYGSVNTDNEEYSTTYFNVGSSTGNAKDILTGTQIGTNGWTSVYVGTPYEPGIIDANVYLTVGQSYTTYNGYVDIYCVLFVTNSSTATPTWSDIHHTQRLRLQAEKTTSTTTPSIQINNLSFHFLSTFTSDISSSSYVKAAVYYVTNSGFNGLGIYAASLYCDVIQGHTHTITSNNQYHDISDTTHGHTTSSTHDHDTTSGLTYLGSGCTSPSIVVTDADSNVTTFTLTGSGIISITENIRSALSSGNNIIKINSGSDCSCTARATYISY